MSIVVVGGGAAGLMAAAAAAQAGANVLLLERNEKLGKKLYITGKGRCNVTNACDTQDLFGQILRNAKFMYSAIYTFDNFRVMDFFEQNGTQTGAAAYFRYPTMRPTLSARFQTRSSAARWTCACIQGLRLCQSRWIALLSKIPMEHRLRQTR